MKRLFNYLMVLLFVLPTNLVRSQDAELLTNIHAQLNPPDKKSIKKAERHIASAKEQSKIADDLESESKSKATKKRIIASKEMGKANKIRYKVYTRDLNRFLETTVDKDNKTAEKKMKKAAALMKEAKKKRGASLRLNIAESAYAVSVQADEYEKRAIVNLLNVYNIFIGMSTVANEETVKVEQNKPEGKTTKNNKAIVTANKTKTNTSNKNMEVETSEPIKIQGSSGVFFLIQIAASKAPMSTSELKNTYKIKNQLHSEKFGEWHKYFINKKFKSHEDAIAYKTNLNVRGIFVIAYKNGQKVSLSEALKKDNTKIEDISKKNVVKEKTIIESVSKTVYRLQIGISTKPLSANNIRLFKNGGKPVVSVSHGGWYSYTIGDFNSQTEALNFKRIKHLTDADVVKFKNGKPID